MQEEILRRKLEEEFRRRKEVNPRYSLRAFARFLSLDPSFVCKLLKGKRRFTDSIATHLELKLQIEDRIKSQQI